MLPVVATMKAVVYREYGPPEVLSLQDLPIPEPKAGELRVEVECVSLNGSDWEILRGKPLYSRFWGLRRPAYPVLGSDIAGRVDAVGTEVSGFAVGDEVYGDTLGAFGGFAEYACAPAKMWRRRPPELGAERACTLPQGGLLALQSLRNGNRVGAGSSVLVNGAGGSAGSFAVQIAKSLGASVTAVDNAEKADYLRSLGADHVIDYAAEDFTKTGTRYDFILDLIASRSVLDVRRALAPGGAYYLVGGSMNALLQALALGPLVATQGRHIGVLAHEPNKYLEDLAALVVPGKVTPVIARRFPLEEVADALRYHGGGHARGKVVIDVRGARSASGRSAS